MDIGSIFLILALLIPVTLFIVRPVIDRKLATTNQPQLDASSLLAERDHVVTSIQDLDDDYNLGKIPAADYPDQRLQLMQYGADILRKIDELQGKPISLLPEDRIEAALAAHRQAVEAGYSPSRKNGNAVPPVPDDELEQKIASRRRTMQGRASGFCPKCGRPVQSTDRFCPRCGATLS
jgi:hypothetical protein